MRSSRSKSRRSSVLTRLRERVAELEETLRAIRAGEVDALVVERGGQHRVFTLEGADAAFRMIVEQMSDGALTIRPNGVILYCNPRFPELVGEPMERVIGSSLTRFVSEPSLQALAQMLVLAQESAQRRELSLVGAGGAEMPVLLSMTSLKDYAVPALCVSVADLTAHKRQAELAAFNDELERRVVARTKDLSIANRELEAFGYSASHDLRGPLRTIASFTELLSLRLGSRLSEDEASYMKFIRGGVKRMAQIIDAILALSRTARASLLCERVDLSRMADEIFEELHAAAPERRASFEVEPGLIVEGDPRLLRQALQNLFDNAWKFTGTRHDAKIAFMSVADPEGGRAFCVRDNGVGFDMAYADKIFEPFHRLHTETRFEGSGIGLALVHRIVERHGGRLWAQSRPGHGASFFFTLPSPAPEALRGA